MINNGKRMLVMLLAAGMLMSGKNVNKILLQTWLQIKIL